MMSEITAEIEEIANINFIGNIIPLQWFQHIKMKNGKPDTISILVLSDIIDWYIPIQLKDKISGEIKYKKKFETDLLQRGIKNLKKNLALVAHKLKILYKDLKTLDL